MTTRVLGSFALLHCYALECGYQLLSLWRAPAFALPTLMFPAMFYVFFGLLFNMGGGVHMPTYLVATFGTFGVMAPALFGFGVGVAAERGQGWLRLKRASPMPPGAYLAAKLFTVMAFALTVTVVLFMLAALFGEVRLTRGQWLATALVLTLGSVPFCAMGLAIGLVAGTQSAPAIVNLLYLPMAFLSGLWVPMQMFPGWLQGLAQWLPPYHLSRLALHSVGLAPGVDLLIHAAVLVLTTLMFGWLSLLAWRRMSDE